jgi:hypothetical protein
LHSSQKNTRDERRGLIVERYYSTTDLASNLGLGIATIADYAKRGLFGKGAFKMHTLGWRIPQSGVDQFLAEKKTETWSSSLKG